jgi:spermidine synthase
VSDWAEETLHADFRIRLRASKVLYDSKTDHQRLVLIENDTFGRVLLLDDVVQTTERDEFIYHEMLSHVPILAHGAVRRVLIIGGGDGGMLEEMLKHETIEAVDQVEIDESVIDFSKTYLSSICGDAFADPRARVVIADGAAYVADCVARYDVIVIDSTDPIGPGAALFTETFYGNCKRCLNDGGVLVTQNGVPFLQAAELTQTLAALKDLFEDATCYLATIPTYVGGPMAFGWASDNPALRHVDPAELERRYHLSRIATNYYNPAVHVAAFALPGYIHAMIR